MNKHTAILLYTIIISLLIFPTSVSADTLTSPSFRIKTGTINIGGGTKSNPNYKLSDTIGQTIGNQFDSSGYRLRAGFQYMRNITPFSLKINSLSATFNNLIPNSFNNASTILTVSAGGAYGYTVKAIQNHPLTITGGSATIPNTTCDPLLPCSATDATPWISASSYGFGYNMSGDDVDQTDFIDSTYFRPFADNAKSENPATIMHKSGATNTSTAYVNFRLSASSAQPNGSYENAIQYIAIPAF